FVCERAAKRYSNTDRRCCYTIQPARRHKRCGVQFCSGLPARSFQKPRRDAGPFGKIGHRESIRNTIAKTREKPMAVELKSRRHTTADLDSAIELCYTNGWTDGMPVVPPTEQRIRAMLDAAGLEPDKQLAFIENRQISVTAEKVAINAV